MTPLLPILYLLFHSIGTSLHSIISFPPLHTIILSRPPSLLLSICQHPHSTLSLPQVATYVTRLLTHALLWCSPTPFFLSLSLYFPILAYLYWKVLWFLKDWSDTYEMTNSIPSLPLISARTLIFGMGRHTDIMWLEVDIRCWPIIFLVQLLIPLP